jgi:hypothetical protein
VDYNNSSHVRRFVSRIELGLLGISHKIGEGGGGGFRSVSYQLWVYLWP